MAYGFESYDANGYLSYTSNSAVVSFRGQKTFTATLAGGGYLNVTLNGVSSQAQLDANWAFLVWPENEEYPPAFSYVSTDTIRITDTRPTSDTTNKYYAVSATYWNL